MLWRIYIFAGLVSVALMGCVPVPMPDCHSTVLQVGASHPVLTDPDSNDRAIIFGQIHVGSKNARAPIYIDLIRFKDGIFSGSQPYAIDRSLQLRSEGRFLWSIPLGNYNISSIHYYFYNKKDDSYLKRHLKTKIRISVFQPKFYYLGALTVKVSDSNEIESFVVNNELNSEKSLSKDLGLHSKDMVNVTLMDPHVRKDEVVVDERSVCDTELDWCIPWYPTLLLCRSMLPKKYR